MAEKKKRPFFINHEQGYTQFDQHYAASTEKNGQTVLFIQDQKAWDSKGEEGSSFSVNLDTHTIWKDGRPAPMSREDFVKIKNILSKDPIQTVHEEDSPRHRNTRSPSIRTAQSTEQRFSIQEKQKEFSALNLEGQRYKGEQEAALRDIYLSALKGKTLELNNKEVQFSISSSHEAKKLLEKLYNNLDPWTSCKKNFYKKSLTLSVDKKYSSSNKHTISYDNEKKIITIPKDVYIDIINRGGDRSVARFCSW